jgi:single-strand DNA-binding protein
VVLTGRTTRDAELKYTAGGMAIASVSLAVNRSVKKGEQWEDEPSFFDATIFGKMAETLAPMLAKGTACTVEGELRQERWQNKEGENRSKVVVIVNNLRLHARAEAPRQQAPPVQQDAFGPDDYPGQIPF